MCLNDLDGFATGATFFRQIHPHHSVWWMSYVLRMTFTSGSCACSCETILESIKKSHSFEVFRIYSDIPWNSPCLPIHIRRGHIWRDKIWQVKWTWNGLTFPRSALLNLFAAWSLVVHIFEDAGKKNMAQWGLPLLDVEGEWPLRMLLHCDDIHEKQTNFAPSKNCNSSSRWYRAIGMRILRIVRLDKDRQLKQLARTSLI